MTRDIRGSQLLPPRWGDDNLSQFLGESFGNQLATFVHKPKHFSLLSRINETFQTCGRALDNSPQFLPSIFLLRSHSTFLASVRLASSGQVPETFPLLRSALEYALYAHHVARDETRSYIWVSRHDDEASMKRCRREFTHSRVIESLKAHLPALHPVIEKLYEQTIDFGAHPNERGLSSSTVFVSEGSKNIFRVAQLQGGGEAMNFGLHVTAQVGLTAMSVFEQLYSNQFRELGVTIMLETLRREL